MRSTEDLLPEQKPRTGRKRRYKLRGRAQPYRPVDRQPGPTLSAMLKGAPSYLPNPADHTRAVAKASRRTKRRFRRSR